MDSDMLRGMHLDGDFTTMENSSINSDLAASLFNATSLVVRGASSFMADDLLTAPGIMKTVGNESLVPANSTPPQFRSPLQAAFPWHAVVMVASNSIILMCSVVGNTLVILTLSRNKRLRTVTNAFLVNLAVSDLMLGLVCVPVTLVGAILRNFIFGEILCKLIPYLQAVSVSVSVWTLVSISLERFFAICRPLRSRQWQTLSHAHRMIAAIWIGSLLIMSPIVCFSRLLPTRIKGKVKCREVWPNPSWEQAFNLCLDVVLLIVPLALMSTLYANIIHKLRLGLQVKMPSRQDVVKDGGRDETTSVKLRPRPSSAQLTTMRSTCSPNEGSKKRVIRMLYVLVIEFFVCWTPLYVVNTWSLFDPQYVYSTLGVLGMSTVHLLAYVSSCCNPITYCFMHPKFRHHFRAMLHCVPSHPTRKSSSYYSDSYATTLTSTSISRASRVGYSKKIDENSM